MPHTGFDCCHQIVYPALPGVNPEQYRCGSKAKTKQIINSLNYWQLFLIIQLHMYKLHFVFMSKACKSNFFFMNTGVS